MRLKSLSLLLFPDRFGLHAVVRSHSAGQRRPDERLRQAAQRRQRAGSACVSCTEYDYIQFNCTALITTSGTHISLG